MKSHKLLPIALGFAFGAALNASGQQTTNVPPPHSLTPPAFDLSKLPADLRALLAQFKDQRSTLVATARSLQDALKGATKEQREAILHQFAADNKALIDSQRELARQIRMELRTLRHQRPAGG